MRWTAREKEAQKNKSDTFLRVTRIDDTWFITSSDHRTIAGDNLHDIMGDMATAIKETICKTEN